MTILTHVEVWPSEESRLIWTLLSGPVTCLETAIYPEDGQFPIQKIFLDADNAF